jgi:hypothetical protein
MEIDTYLGMGVSNIVALFIVVTTAPRCMPMG